MDIDSDPIDGIEAEPADVIEQAQPPASEPIAEALDDRAAVPAVDPELTGVEAEEAEDSGQS